MANKILGIVLLTLALVSTCAAFGLFYRCILPGWRSPAPETVHATVTIAPFQFSGWQLFIPVTALAAVAAGCAWYGFALLSTKE